MSKPMPREGGKTAKRATDAPPEPGYDAWLDGEIAEGSAELDAGMGVPAERVWKELGLE